MTRDTKFCENILEKVVIQRLEALEALQQVHTVGGAELSGRHYVRGRRRSRLVAGVKMRQNEAFISQNTFHELSKLHS